MAPNISADIPWDIMKDCQSVCWEDILLWVFVFLVTLVFLILLVLLVLVFLRGRR